MWPGFLFDFLSLSERLPHLAPHPDDVGYHERYRYGHPRHDFKREEAGRAVVKGQGILYVHRRDIIGGIVEAGYEQDGPDCEQCARAHDVEILSDALSEEMPSETCQDEDYTEQEYHGYPPCMQHIVQVLERLGRYCACRWIHRVAGPEEEPQNEGHECQDEGGSGDHQPPAAFIRKCADIRLGQQVEQA